MKAGAARYPPLRANPTERRMLVAWLVKAVLAADADRGDGSFSQPLDGDSGALARSSGRKRHAIDETSDERESSPARSDVGTLAPPAVGPDSMADLPALAEGHGVAAQLSTAALGSLPESVRVAIEDAAARTLARGERLTAERHQIAAAFHASGVPFCWLKGAWLAGLASPEPPPATNTSRPTGLSRWSRRPAADIDVLVPASALGDAAQLLGQLGYRRDHRTARHEVFLRPNDRTVADYRGEHAANPMPVEVHTRLAESFRGIGVDWTDHVAFSPSPDPASAELPLALGLLHLAAHATADALNRRLRLAALFDLHWLAPSLSDADWAVVLELGSRHEAARFVWPALAMASRLGRSESASTDQTRDDSAIPVAVFAALEGTVRPPSSLGREAGRG